MSAKRSAKVTLVSLVAFAVAPWLQAEAAIPGPTVVTYAGGTGDLFLEDDRIDVSLEVEAQVPWELEAASVFPGGRAERDIEPTQGPLRITLEYSLRPTCCPEREATGTTTATDVVRIGDAPPVIVPLDGGWTAAFTVTGELRARMGVAPSPGTVDPRELTWKTWAPQRLVVTADETAPAGAVIQVTGSTAYVGTVTATVTHSSGGLRYASPPYALGELPGDVTLTRDFVVVTSDDGPGGDGTEVGGESGTPFGPRLAPIAAICFAGLAARARRR